MPFSAGDHVIVRGEPWVIEEATAFADCALLSLSGADSPGAENRRTLLIPFDRPAIADTIPKIRAVTPRRWIRLLRTTVSTLRVHGQLRAAAHATIDILPFQLEPALALIHGRASRFLLADEVGLGKTIQAGLMLAELRQRGWCERALIVTPSGLRTQWADELRHRFDLRATVMDTASVSMLSRSLPPGVNPWTVEPVVITSIDFVKQPEVLRALTAQTWDLLIFDEAHQATAASLRHDAVQELATRARHVVLLTATPHAGDQHAYRALCALGQFDGEAPILLFRRTREQAALAGRRRAHLIAVRPTAEAIAMHRILDVYLTDLWRLAPNAGKQDVRLVAMVLAKRAFSSAHSLARSLERRLAGLAGPVEAPAQQPLPFDCDADASDEPLLPAIQAFDRTEDECAVLQRLIDQARRAQIDERKMHALRRILRRVHEPVIVFTEYRDTLDAIAEGVGTLRRTRMIHGGQTSQERRDAASAFTSGIADLLLATDAGSEGLNLQRRCRLVVNLELPWNPIRLEQRIGRVDRIGQTRTVHAINLFAAGTAEDEVLANLLRRLDCIRMSEIEMAACVIDRTVPAPRPRPLEPYSKTVDLGVTAALEARRIAEVRAITTGHEQPVLQGGIVPVAVRRLRVGGSLTRPRRSSVIALMRVRLVAVAGRLIEDTLVPVRVPASTLPGHLNRREVQNMGEALLGIIRPDLVRLATAHARLREEAIAAGTAEWIACAIERERQLARRAESHAAPAVQAGLFDTRAVRHQLDIRLHSDAIGRETTTRTNLLEAESRVFLPHDPEVALLLITC
jgi:superfamily II DNA or RNA helicase